jgi:SNF2 family DNA or RNA helicase
MIWCHLNPEGDLLEKLIPDGKQISGSMDDDEKEEVYSAFRHRQLRNLIIKDKIGAWGLNCQFCDHVVRFATHSYEAHYQAVRRCYRFGQKNPVTVDLIVTEGEQGVKENLQRKAKNADRMFTELVKHMHSAIRIGEGAFEKKAEVPSWL